MLQELEDHSVKDDHFCRYGAAVLKSNELCLDVTIHGVGVVLRYSHLACTFNF